MPQMDSLIGQATIELEGTGALAADATGKFSLPAKYSKTKSITISSVGYKSIKVHLTDNENQAFRLERYNLMMAPVEVRATRAADNAPFTKTNISKARLKNRIWARTFPTC